MENIIKKAIDGGYKKDELDGCTIHFIHENALDGECDCLVIDNSYSEHTTGLRKGCAIHYPKEYILLDPLFWQALGKACGWEGKNTILLDNNEDYQKVDKRIRFALQFHEINLTQGFNKAVEWLEDLIK